MTDSNQTPRASIRTGASLTDDMVRLAANEERLSAKLATYFFLAIFLAGFLLLLLVWNRSSNTLPGDTEEMLRMMLFVSAGLMALGGIGSWIAQRASKKIGDGLGRH